MNNKTGMYASLVTLAAVVVFAVSMIVGNSSVSYLASMFIAWGFIPMIGAFVADSEKESKAVSYTALVFAAIYGTLIMIVYFAQLTVVRLANLSLPIAQILDYQKFGLFFSYNLLGYGFMALTTFFIALSFKAESKADKALKVLLLVHGLFAISCLVIPMMGIFSSDMAGSGLIGILVLEFWCAYFIPVCILSFLHFKNQRL
ncbi:hypothetical protein ACIZ62_01570 [Acetobacterium carbinolicum]|jgi:hypothetical protein|uniref:hypothetical protein n=1 Tax=Acetobacterium TaxID=33951 RepID=UPI001FA8BC10|nr:MULTISPECIES: hypothetical protein [unclassified Acetobacterium]MDZ5724267.1 hypothetical protein [Acetobacterium sp. K1/6]